MSAPEVDQSGEIGHVHHSQRQVLLDFMSHLKLNGFLRFSYPMPDQERGAGWMMFLYEQVPDNVINSFGD
ncbi:MAG: hypothetical protein P8Q90_05315 [Candidatus Thalassarchaeaceae archaeon]|jgi:hypothetical protein|nr:hypothetical protein [Candidatus Thalassarchaeaceae archaeon]